MNLKNIIKWLDLEIMKRTANKQNIFTIEEFNEFVPKIIIKIELNNMIAEATIWNNGYTSFMVGDKITGKFLYDKHDLILKDNQFDLIFNDFFKHLGI